MPQRVFLHVGLPKSGTTYIQAVLHKNKSALGARADLLYPGENWGAQVNAVRDVRTPKGRTRGAAGGAWDRVVAEMREWHGSSVLSMEWLCMANRRQVQRIADDLSWAECHVVFTVRDLARTVPAAWQEATQNRRTWRWAEFLQEVSADQPEATPAGAAFWRHQDMTLLLGRWGSVFPPDRLHVITVPRRGADPELLWQRMAEVLRIEPDGYDHSALGANASLGLESAELMRRVNELVRDRGVPLRTYSRLFKHGLAKRILAARRSSESPVELPVSLHEWVRRQADRQIGAIEESGVHVVGDLSELRPALNPSAAPAEAIEPSTEAVLDAAVAALVTVVLRKSRPGRRSISRPGQRSSAAMGARRRGASWARAAISTARGLRPAQWRPGASR